MNQTQDNDEYPKYLYGAAVQGIQGFIFQTNRLREIVGASELVERICTDLFAELLFANRTMPEGSDRRRVLLAELSKETNAIQNAAGNIKYIFDSEEECRRVVRFFPKTVMEFAPGITISQSVVKMEKGNSFEDAVTILEKNLRTQRNRQMRDLSIGLMGILRSRETGLPVTHIKNYDGNTEYLDSATYHKLYDESDKRKTTFTILCRKAFGDAIDTDCLWKQKRLPVEIKEMTRDNDWIAIIHADGNGLGQIVQTIGSDKDKFKEFSRALDEATKLAARKAFQEVVTEDLSKDKTIPMRPIVLSGDDHTVICRADIAIPYTKKFLKYFEKETKGKLGRMLVENNVFNNENNEADKLTACAGIAFVKSSFPFHFGYQLAEALCDRAKKDTKALFDAEAGNLPASCLMFHKVQDSFVVNYNDIVERELTPQPDISFEFGPYYLDPVSVERTTDNGESKEEKRWSVKELTDKVKTLQGGQGNAVKSGLRNWLTLLHDNPGMAEQKLGRMKDIASTDDLKKLIDDITGNAVRIKKEKIDDKSERNVTVYPVYDILALNSVSNQITKTPKNTEK